MTEYIPKDKALDYLKYWKHLEAYDQIRDEQGIDIVFCNECKHNHDSTCEYAEWECNADDFCSYGERQTERSRE